MAVTGQIGSDNVILDNAATEATLKLILQAITASGLKNKDALKELAKSAGLNTDATKQALDNVADGSEGVSTQFKSLEASQKRWKAVNDGVLGSMKDLMNGTATLSGFIEKIQVGGPLVQTFLSGLAKAASIQEENMAAYQKATSVGVNFGGSLTNMRLAAANSFLTLNEFNDIIKNNSKAFTKFGGDATTGSENFFKASRYLLQESDGAGKRLLALGYTSEQVNQGLADYVSASGYRNAKEAKNYEAIAKSGAEYMEQLDGLARLTGESRQQLAEEIKKKAANAAFEAKLSGMSEEERKKAMTGLANALATGGEGAADAFQAQVMGMAPTTKAGQQYTAMFGEAAEGIRKSADMVADKNKTTADLNEQMYEIQNAQIRDGEKYGEQTMFALTTMGGELSQTAQTVQSSNNRLKAEGEEGRRRAMEKRKIEETEAAQMAKMTTGLKELGAALWNAFNPIIRVVTPLFGILGNLAGKLAEVINKGGLLSTAIVAVTTALIAYKAKALVTETVKGGAGIGRSVIGAVTGGRGGGGAAGGGGGGPLESLGKVGGSGGMLEGIATGLKAFTPQVLIGAGIFAASIAAIGAGIAAAAWLTGKALPTLAEGMKALSELDAESLGSVGLSLGKVGLGLLAFVPFGITGLPAAFAVNNLAEGIAKLNNVDPDKLERVAASMKKIKDSSPGIGASIAAGISNLFGPSEKPAAEGTANVAAAVGAGGSGSLDELVSELKTLNKQEVEVLRVLKDMLENTKKNLDATKSLNRNLFPS